MTNSYSKKTMKTALVLVIAMIMASISGILVMADEVLTPPQGLEAATDGRATINFFIDDVLQTSISGYANDGETVEIPEIKDDESGFVDGITVDAAAEERINRDDVYLFGWDKTFSNNFGINETLTPYQYDSFVAEEGEVYNFYAYTARFEGVGIDKTFDGETSEVHVNIYGLKNGEEYMIDTNDDGEFYNPNPSNSTYAFLVRYTYNPDADKTIANSQYTLSHHNDPHGNLEFTNAAETTLHYYVSYINRGVNFELFGSIDVNIDSRNVIATVPNGGEKLLGDADPDFSSLSDGITVEWDGAIPSDLPADAPALVPEKGVDFGNVIRNGAGTPEGESTGIKDGVMEVEDYTMWKSYYLHTDGKLYLEYKEYGTWIEPWYTVYPNYNVTFVNGDFEVYEEENLDDGDTPLDDGKDEPTDNDDNNNNNNNDNNNDNEEDITDNKTPLDPQPLPEEEILDSTIPLTGAQNDIGIIAVILTVVVLVIATGAAVVFKKRKSN